MTFFLFLTNSDDVPNIASILGDLTPSPATPGLPPLKASTSGVEREPNIKPEASPLESASPISDPRNLHDHRAVFRERRAAPQAHHEQLVLQLKESAEL